MSPGTVNVIQILLSASSTRFLRQVACILTTLSLHNYLSALKCPWANPRSQPASLQLKICS